MPFTTVCPNCDARLTAPDAVRGKKVKCKKCDEPFVARPVGGPEDDEDDRPAKPAKAARPRRDRDDEDEAQPRKPARASRARDDEDDEPRGRRSRDDEDEPRARRKGKKRKKAAGNSGMLIALLVIAAVVLIGGGVGAYFAFIKEEKPADNSVAKGGAPPAPPPGPGAKGGPGVGGAWVEQHDPDGRYRVKFPSAPRTQNVTQQTPAGPVTLKVYLAGGQTEAFVSTHQQLPAERGGVTDDQILEQAIAGAKQQAPGATAGPTQSITYESLPGREVTLTFPGKKGAMVIRVLLAGDRVIALSAAGDTAAADAPRVKQFFESLKVE